jgi:hypothetical protein
MVELTSAEDRDIKRLMGSIDPALAREARQRRMDFLCELEPLRRGGVLRTPGFQGPIYEDPAYNLPPERQAYFRELDNAQFAAHQRLREALEARAVELFGEDRRIAADERWNLSSTAFDKIMPSQQPVCMSDNRRRQPTPFA